MIRIDDTAEISALHKAILAAKFSGVPENDELSGDPTLAGLSNRVYDAVSRQQDKTILDEAALQELRRIKTSQGYRKQWRTAVMAARRDPLMSSASPEERISMAKCYLSPFTCKEGELREFLDEVDGKVGEHDLGKLFGGNSFNGAMLLEAEYSFGKKQAHIVLMLTDRRVCDLYMSDIGRFEMSYPDEKSSDVPEMPTVKKITASSGSTHKLDAVFAGRFGKMTLSAESNSVDYWL